jgi:hypothetical protein
VLNALRVQVVLESIEQLRKTSAGQRKVFGALPGPNLFLNMIDRKTLETEDLVFPVGDILLTLARAMGEAGAEGIVLYERKPPEEDSRNCISKLLSSIKRVGEHFSLDIIILVAEGSASAISEMIRSCEPHGLITSRKISGELLEMRASMGNTRLGIGLSEDFFYKEKQKELQKITEAVIKENLLLSNQWAIPPHTDLRRLREFGEFVARSFS